MEQNKQAAIVTGAAGGIGSAVVNRLSAAGMRVLMVDADPDHLRQAAAGFPADQVVPFVADVTDAAAVQAASDHAMAAFGRIDVLVNVAGGAGPIRVHEIENIEIDTWNHVFDLNVTSVFLFCRAVMPAMRRQGFGRIVNFSSILAYGEKGPPTTVAARLPYATVKAALLGFTSQLAKDVAADGITVNALVPGLILGEKGTRIRERFEALSEDQRAGMLAGYPIARAGEADEVAAAVEFLVSKSAGYISGVALPVDGAYH